MSLPSPSKRRKIDEKDWILRSSLTRKPKRFFDDVERHFSRVLGVLLSPVDTTEEIIHLFLTKVKQMVQKMPECARVVVPDDATGGYDADILMRLLFLGEFRHELQALDLFDPWFALVGDLIRIYPPALCWNDSSLLVDLMIRRDLFPVYYILEHHPETLRAYQGQYSVVRPLCDYVMRRGGDFSRSTFWRMLFAHPQNASLQGPACETLLHLVCYHMIPLHLDFEFMRDLHDLYPHAATVEDTDGDVPLAMLLGHMMQHPDSANMADCWKFTSFLAQTYPEQVRLGSVSGVRAHVFRFFAIERHFRHALPFFRLLDRDQIQPMVSLSFLMPRAGEDFTFQFRQPLDYPFVRDVLDGVARESNVEERMDAAQDLLVRLESTDLPSHALARQVHLLLLSQWRLDVRHLQVELAALREDANRVCDDYECGLRRNIV